MRFSVIIPALNEEATIAQCLSALPRGSDDVEIIVVDGGSDDATASICATYRVQLVSAARGRGVQLNAGARASTGDVLVFLHADSRVARGFIEFLAGQFQDPALCCGAFRAAYDSPSPVLRIYSWFTRFETRLTTFGDQCLVVRRPFFEQLGGFPDWPLFEDMEFLKKARKETLVRKFALEVVTSARKFRQGGAILQQLRNVTTITLFHLGVSPQRLYTRYYGTKNGTPNEPPMKKNQSVEGRAMKVNEEC